jgi:hypothetical protein
MRVIVERLVEWRLAGETEALGENLPQRHFVHHKSHMTRPRARTQAVGVGSRRQFENKTHYHTMFSGRSEQIAAKTSCASQPNSAELFSFEVVTVSTSGCDFWYDISTISRTNSHLASLFFFFFFLEYVTELENLFSTVAEVKKSKAIPVTGRGGPLGCETSRLPHFLDNLLTHGGEVK